MSTMVRASPLSPTREDITRFKKILHTGDLVYFPHATCAFGEGTTGHWEPYRVTCKIADTVVCKPTYRTALLPQVVSYASLLSTMLRFEAAVAAGTVTQVGHVRAWAGDAVADPLQP